MAFMQQLPHETNQIIFWVGWFLCLLYLVDSVVLWNYRLALSLLIFLVAGVLCLEILQLEVTRSWLGLISWLIALASVVVGWLQLEYSIYRWQNRKT